MEITPQYDIDEMKILGFEQIVFTIVEICKIDN